MHASTKKVRETIHAAIAAIEYAAIGGTFVEREDGKRVVTYGVAKPQEVAALANKTLRDAGYNNEVRVISDADVAKGKHYGLLQEV